MTRQWLNQTLRRANYGLRWKMGVCEILPANIEQAFCACEAVCIMHRRVDAEYPNLDLAIVKFIGQLHRHLRRRIIDSGTDNTQIRRNYVYTTGRRQPQGWAVCEEPKWLLKPLVTSFTISSTWPPTKHMEKRSSHSQPQNIWEIESTKEISETIICTKVKHNEVAMGPIISSGSGDV